MTRRDLANGLRAMDPRDISGKSRHEARFICETAAIELLNTCATCLWWIPSDPTKAESDARFGSAWCGQFISEVPTDGSGFCHKHERNPLAPVDPKAVTK